MTSNPNDRQMRGTTATTEAMEESTPAFEQGDAATTRARWFALLLAPEQPFSMLLQANLEVEGWTVHWARDVEHADMLSAHHTYHVLVADTEVSPNIVPMLALINVFRMWTPATRVVVLAAGEAADAEEAFGFLGVAAFLRKPAPLPELLALVSGLAKALP